MAQAVKELFPETKVAIGPAIENGFYYDFDRQESFAPDDLKKIEKAMRRIIQAKIPITQKMVDKAQAIKMFTEVGEMYKLELIHEIPDKQVSIFYTGDQWFDLCKGPHVQNTGEIKAFKLLSIAGSYWRGNENNAQLQRIYGTCFPSEKELKEYLNQLEEAKKRDHRKLGPELDLFNIYQEDAGAGLAFYHPHGAIIRTIIEDYLKEQNTRRGYQMVITPHVLSGKLWEISGHANYYRDLMYYVDVDAEEYAVKPMNCPAHILIVKSKIRSYREMPLRLFELGTVYRREKAGVLHGLFRVRGFTQDDGHIFCRQDQIKSEVMDAVDFVFDVMRDFGFQDMEIEISTKPEKSIGRERDWEAATEALKESLDEKNLRYNICEGEGAFYGPKIDIKLKDAIGRMWQCATIQCDFALPEKFNVNYVDEKGEDCRCILIHRAILGSIDRFFGTLIEHYAGAFPLWLAPVQVQMIPIRENHESYCQKMKGDLQKAGLRVIIDNRNETLNKRIREGTVRKIPYLLIAGDKEVDNRSISVRKRVEGDQGVMTVEDLIKRLKEEIVLKV